MPFYLGSKRINKAVAVYHKGVLVNSPHTTVSTYYINATTGNDTTNNGLSTSTPWKTINKVNNRTFNPGDSILFKRGETWYEHLIVPSSGSAEKPITFGAYGNGEKPILTQSIELDGLTWVNVTGSIYQATGINNIPGSCDAAWIDTYTPLTKGTSESLTEAGSFWPNAAGQTITVWLPSGGNPTGHSLHVSINSNGILTCDKSFVVIRDLHFAHSANTDMVLLGGLTTTNIIVTGCDIGPTYGTGITAGFSNGIIENNVFHDCWDGGDAGTGLILTSNTNGTTVRRNISRNNYIGIGTTGQPNSLTISNNIVSNNLIYGIDIRGMSSGFPGNIFNNTVIHSSGTGYGIGVQTATGSGCGIKNNIVTVTYTGTPNDLQAISISDDSSNDINNNCYSFPNGYTGGIGKLGAVEYLSFSSWKTALASSNVLGKDISSVEDDPLFTNLNTGDYTLQPGSPCINAGVDINITHDYAGNPISDTPSIGAFEYQAPVIEPYYFYTGTGDRFFLDDGSMLVFDPAISETYFFCAGDGTPFVAQNGDVLTEEI